MDTTILRILRGHGLTRRLSGEELEHLASMARVVCYLPGTYLFYESQPRRTFGILLKGRLEIQKGDRARPQLLHVLGPGDSDRKSVV